MTTAFVLIDVEIGAESEVLKALINVEGVEEAYFVYGVYDVVVKIKAESMYDLTQIVIRILKGYIWDTVMISSRKRKSVLIS